jgi:hypothetical protein
MRLAPLMPTTRRRAVPPGQRKRADVLRGQSPDLLA